MVESTPSTLLLSSGICSPSWTSPWLRSRTCHWVGEPVWFSPAFVNVKLTFHLRISGSPSLSQWDLCSQEEGPAALEALGSSGPGFAEQSTEWWRRRHLLFPLHNILPQMCTTPLASVSLSQKFLYRLTPGSPDFLFIRPTQKTRVNSLWQPYELRVGKHLITPWNVMTYHNQAEFLKVLTAPGPASSASFPKAMQTWECIPRSRHQWWHCH